jgi:hypothetical protein
VNTATNFQWSIKFEEFIARWLLRKYSALSNSLLLKINFSARFLSSKLSDCTQITIPSINLDVNKRKDFFSEIRRK